MMAVISKRLEVVEDWIEPLVQQSRYGTKHPHGDGYGVAFYESGQLHTRREVAPIWERKTDFSGDAGKILILHTRKASKGSINLNNVHPFTATTDDDSFVFCHNGTIFDIDKLNPSKTTDYEDASDSRIFFELFLNKYEFSGDFVEAVRSTVSDIAATCSSITSMNSFFSNGKQLIAVRYCLDEEDYYTLGYTKLRDSDDGYVITTQQYDDKTSWQWLENKTITVFQSDGFQQFNISDH
jgi:glutamine amidotransferase